MATFDLLAGVAGSILLIIAWAWEAWENIKSRKLTIHLHFSVLYIIGSVLLAIYAWCINSMIYFILGLFLLAAIIIETLYALKVKHGRRK